MNLSRRIANGIWASLLYDYCSMRGNLFNESYLLNSVGNILQSYFGGKNYIVTAGFQHPILSKLTRKAGRRPEIDYVVSKYDDSSSNRRKRSKLEPIWKDKNINLIQTAIETKWAGSSHCTPENLILDILRMSILVRENSDLEAFVLLAGRREHIKDLKSGLTNLLKLNTGTHVLKLKPKIENLNFLSKIFKSKSLQNFDFPTSINYKAFEVELSGDPCKMSVIILQVSNSSQSKTFKPSDIPDFNITKLASVK